MVSPGLDGSEAGAAQAPATSSRTSASARTVRSTAGRGPGSASTSPRSRSRPACRPATDAGPRRTAPSSVAPSTAATRRANASASPRRTSSGVRSRFSARIRSFQASGSQGSSSPGYGSTPERTPSITAAEWWLHHSMWARTSLRVQPVHAGRRPEQRVVVHLGGGRLDEGVGLADLAEQRVLVHGAQPSHGPSASMRVTSARAASQSARDEPVRDVRPERVVGAEARVEEVERGRRVGVAPCPASP